MEGQDGVAILEGYIRLCKAIVAVTEFDLTEKQYKNQRDIDDYNRNRKEASEFIETAEYVWFVKISKIDLGVKQYRSRDD